MEKNYVDRAEFDQLKKEVDGIKQELAESARLLIEIDKKIDRIDGKVITADKIEDLKLTPLEKRVSSLEDIVKWIRRTIFGGLTTIIIGAIVFVIKLQ